MTKVFSFSIISGNDLPDQENLIHQLCQIDKICYGDIAEQDQGTEEYWKRISQASLAQVVIFQGQPIGYVDFLKISDVGLEVLKTGKIHDGELETCLDFSDNKELNLYLTSICILPHYRGQGLAKLLWQASQDYFAQAGLTIKNIIAVIWTEEGDHLSRHFATERLAQDPYGHPVVLLGASKISPLLD